jgi:hypothetical protein
MTIARADLIDPSLTRWYGGPVRPAKWLALCLASFGLVDAVGNLDEAVNTYYAAVRSTALDFSVARWRMSAPAFAGVALIVAAVIFLRRPTRDGSRLASALTVGGIVSGLFLLQRAIRLPK